VVSLMLAEGVTAVRVGRRRSSLRRKRAV